jgi:hypothetical protein
LVTVEVACGLQDGIIKSALRFRKFLLRGLDNVRSEWSLVTMAWNIERMFTLAGTY